ncbi:calcium-binding protein [Nocardioides cynanchi]|uniref:calcium-binding protein n=1 Tax=Nocardioides cynanchi TaxID=2558918 RepID=UPI0012450C09|nr:calcium-binding protein [Nocardioides cynanchi]
MRFHTIVAAAAAVSLGTAWLTAPATAQVTAPTCGGRVATIVGTPARDVIHGTPGPDVIAGLGGNDWVRGLGGADLICGGAGKDHLRAGPGADLVLGGSGLDFEHRGPGRDTLVGGAGDDFMIDHVRGGTYVGRRGNDEIRVTGPSVVRGGRGLDGIRVRRCGCTILGGPGNDSLDAVARKGPAHLHGGPGRDDVSLEGTVRHAQDLRGGPGHDLLLLVPRLPRTRHTPYRRLVVDLATGLVRTGTARMRFRSFGDAEIDDLTLPHQPHVARAYTLIGNAQDNALSVLFSGGVVPPLRLFGRGGDDQLTGNDGNDLLDGGPGHDAGNGSNGTDRCVSIEEPFACETLTP